MEGDGGVNPAGYFIRDEPMTTRFQPPPTERLGNKRYGSPPPGFESERTEPKSYHARRNTASSSSTVGSSPSGPLVANESP